MEVFRFYLQKKNTNIYALDAVKVDHPTGFSRMGKLFYSIHKNPVCPWWCTIFIH